MSVELIVSGVATAGALGAAWWARSSAGSASRSAGAAEDSARSAKRSAEAAERSAAAEERAADVAAAALTIEQERAADEHLAREKATAPAFVLVLNYEHSVVLRPDGTLTGHLQNIGASTGLLDDAVMRLPDGDQEAAFGAPPPIEVRREVAVPFDVICLDPDAVRASTEKLVLVVSYRAAETAYRARATFTLRRHGSDHIGRPIWLAGEPGVQRL